MVNLVEICKCIKISWMRKLNSRDSNRNSLRMCLIKFDKMISINSKAGKTKVKDLGSIRRPKILGSLNKIEKRDLQIKK
jgi:hypothetical protein